VKYQAVNLAQGFPDFPAPDEIKRAAQEAVGKDINQYAITWGSRHLRAAIARQMQLWQSVTIGSRNRNHGLLRLDRSHDGVVTGNDKPGDEGHHLRALL